MPPREIPIPGRTTGILYTTMTKLDLLNWMSHLQNLHPAVEYTWNISYTSVTFLDVTFYVENNTLKTSIHYKETDAHSYLRYDSFHPDKCKNAIPYSQMLRLRKLISDENVFEERIEEMEKFFQHHLYPQNILDEAKNRVSKVNRDH